MFLPFKKVWTWWALQSGTVNYTENFSELKTILNFLNLEDTASIAVPQECFYKK